MKLAVNKKARITVDNLAAIRAALESAGVEVTEENGGGPGVRPPRGAAAR